MSLGNLCCSSLFNLVWGAYAILNVILISFYWPVHTVTCKLIIQTRKQHPSNDKNNRWIKKLIYQAIKQSKSAKQRQRTLLVEHTQNTTTNITTYITMYTQQQPKTRQVLYQPDKQPTNQLHKQPTNQTSTKPTRKSPNQPDKQTTNQPDKCPTNQTNNQPTRQATYQPDRQPTNQTNNQLDKLLTNHRNNQPTRQIT